MYVVTGVSVCGAAGLFCVLVWIRSVLILTEVQISFTFIFSFDSLKSFIHHIFTGSTRPIQETARNRWVVHVLMYKMVVYMIGESFPYCNHLSWIRMMFSTPPSSPTAPERLQEEQRMMFSTPPSSPMAPERLQELRGTRSSTPASSSKRPVLRMGESMTFKD